jgi:hypothetical protein
MMNEMEIIFFSIYLEKVNWQSGSIRLFDNLMLTALYVKVINFILLLNLYKIYLFLIFNFDSSIIYIILFYLHFFNPKN